MSETNSLLIYLTLTSSLILKPTQTQAGSAVASGPYGEHVVVAGPNYTKKAAEQKALLAAGAEQLVSAWPLLFDPGRKTIWAFRSIYHFHRMFYR